MQDFRNVRAWHLAQAVATEVPRLLPSSRSRSIPGLRNQATRAAISICANIAEGSGKRSREEFRRYLDIAVGSVNELESHLEIALSGGVLPLYDHRYLVRQTDLIRRMLTSLIARLDESISLSSTPQRPTPPDP